MGDLYYGDNLLVMRKHITDESVDLIYLDPPFKSNANYNVLFKSPTGEPSDAQAGAFLDTWEWRPEARHCFEEVMASGSPVAGVLKAMRDFLGENPMMAYLANMAARMIEMHRVLKPTGSLYLHCDPSASHYLKVLLDGVFGAKQFRTEIVWKRSSAHSDTKQGRRQHGRIHDILLFYTKTDDWKWNPIHTPYDQEYVASFYKHVEPVTKRRYRLDNLTGPGGASKGNPKYEVMGVERYWRYSEKKMVELIRQGRVIQAKPGAVPAYKRYLDEMPGVVLQDIWTDIKPLGARARERLGYPTQKPLSLLERVIESSSNPGEVLLDPFCGCGTSVHAAHSLGRNWIGIDVTHYAIALIQQRLEEQFSGLEINVVGRPVDLAGARRLAKDNPRQFQWWATWRLGVSVYNEVPDRGVNGLVFLETVRLALVRLLSP